MFISKNIISFESAQILRAMGIKRPSLFLYHFDVSKMTEPEIIMAKDALEQYDPHCLYHAYLVSEMIEMMPHSIGRAHLKICTSASRYRFIVMYTNRWMRHHNCLADALAELMDFLMERKKINSQEVNGGYSRL